MIWVVIWKEREKTGKVLTKAIVSGNTGRDEERGLVGRRNSGIESSDDEDEDDVLNEQEQQALEIDSGIELHRLATH